VRGSQRRDLITSYHKEAQKRETKKTPLKTGIKEWSPKKESKRSKLIFRDSHHHPPPYLLHLPRKKPDVFSLAE